VPTKAAEPGSAPAKAAEPATAPAPATKPAGDAGAPSKSGEVPK